MPISSLDSHTGPAALVFVCDSDHSQESATILVEDEPLLVVDNIAWPPSAISEARHRGWIVNAAEVRCPGCTRRRPRWPEPDTHEAAARERYDDSHP